MLCGLITTSFAVQNPLLQTADSLYQAREYHAAAIACERVVFAQPDDFKLGAEALLLKAAALKKLQRYTQAQTDYAALLDDLERSFSARTRKMLLEDRSDLTVEIDVLRERLEREGVRVAPGDTE